MPLSGPGPQAPPVPRPRAGGGKYPHALVMFDTEYETAGGAITKDDAGFPIEDDPVETPFRGWIQPQPSPRTPGDLASDEAGLAFSTHLLFAPMSLTPRKNRRIRWDPDNGLHYTIVNEPRDAAGRRHHWEIDLVEYRYEGAA